MCRPSSPAPSRQSRRMDFIESVTGLGSISQLAKPLYENTELEENEGKRGSIVSPRKWARFGGQCAFPGMAMTGVTKWSGFCKVEGCRDPFRAQPVTESPI